MADKTGIPLVQEAVTAAVLLLSRLNRLPGLDEQDRTAVWSVITLLERAEAVLYGSPPTADRYLEPPPPSARP